MTAEKNRETVLVVWRPGLRCDDLSRRARFGIEAVFSDGHIGTIPQESFRTCSTFFVMPLSSLHPSAFPHLRTLYWVGLGLLPMLLLTTGCRQSEPEFESNRVRAMSLEISRDVPTEAAMADVSAVVGELFGTPQTPRWPVDWMANEKQRNLVSIERLQVAAGPVSSDQEDLHTGLYQEHCVICHGISGSGTGPASRYQVPYPRDFRSGVFKWKSTARSEKPTRDDLMRLLDDGIPGTPMPSFSLLSRSDREVLVDYVIYLAVRGEVERDLMAQAIDILDYEETPPGDDLRLALTSTSGHEPAKPRELTEGGEVISEVLDDVLGRWVNATPSPVPPYPDLKSEALEESIQRGKEIFHGPIANCASCHGKNGTGGLPNVDYDDWTKDFTTRIGITPGDKAAVKPFRKAGALPPRRIDPRVLASGGFRGGDDPQTLYRRIEHGIAGTPMPSLEIGEQAQGTTGLSPAQAWDLVNYVRAIGD